MTACTRSMLMTSRRNKVILAKAVHRPQLRGGAATPIESSSCHKHANTSSTTHKHSLEGPSMTQEVLKCAGASAVLVWDTYTAGGSKQHTCVPPMLYRLMKQALNTVHCWQPYTTPHVQGTVPHTCTSSWTIFTKHIYTAHSYG